MNALIVFAALIIVATPIVVASRFAIATHVSPLHVLAASLFLGVGFKTVAWIADPQRTIFNLYASDPDNMLMGYVFVLLFVVCVCLGYMLTSGRGVTHRRLFVSARQFQLVLSDTAIIMLATITAAIAFTVAWFYLAQRSAGVTLLEAFTLEGIARLNFTKLDRLEGSGFGAAYSYITVFFAIVPVTFSLLLSQFYVRRVSATLIISTLLTLALWIGAALLRGKRGDLLEMVALVGIVHMCFRQRIAFKTIALGAAGMLMALGLFSLMTTMRASRDSLTFDAPAAIDSSIGQIFYSTYFFDINIASLIVSEMDTTELKNGQTYFDWIVGLVPRAVWPDKPATSLGLYVKSVILHRSGTIGGVNPTMAGEAFINFGWLGAFLGVLWGMLFRWVERTLLSERVLALVGGPWLYAWISFSMVWALAQTSFSIYLTGLLVELAIVATMICLLRWAFPAALSRPITSRRTRDRATPHPRAHFRAYRG